MIGREDQEGHYDSQADSEQDRELLTQLRHAVELRDPPPADLADKARRAFSWDAALQVLVEQEQSNDSVPALRRSDGPQRRDLSYRLPAVSLTLTVDETGEGSWTITGSASPAAAAVELIDHNGDTQSVDVDRKGRFTVTTWAHAVVLQLTSVDGVKVRTPVVDLDQADDQPT